MPNAARAELTPTGRMRVGINFGNTVLVRKDAKGLPCGIAIDLAHELKQRLDVAIDLVTYDAAGAMASGAKSDAWDVAFLATDPARAGEILFTPPYLEIDSTYLVTTDSLFQTPADIDSDGVRIATSDKSAYDLFLTRNLKHAQLVRAAGPSASVELFFTAKLDALAGIRPMLLDVMRDHPSTRVLDGQFSTVQQAIGTPRGREAAAQYLHEFIADIKASGLVTQLIARNGVLGVFAAR